MEDMKTEGAGWLDSAAARYCRELSRANATLAAANAQLEERNAELRAALDEQGDELARVRREAASVPTELDGGRLLIVADSIASDGEGLRTIEAYGRFFEREDGGRDGYLKLPLDMDGVPIRPGDAVEVNADGGYDVFAVTTSRWVDIDGCAHDPKQTRHVKRDALVEVLADFAFEVERGRNTIETARWYADEIRKTVGTDE